MEGIAEMLVRLVGQIPLSRAQLAVVVAASSILIVTLLAVGIVPPSS